MTCSVCFDNRDYHIQNFIPYWQRKVFITTLAVGILALCTAITIGCLNKYLTTSPATNIVFKVVLFVSGSAAAGLFGAVAFMLVVDGVLYLPGKPREVRISLTDYQTDENQSSFTVGDISCFYAEGSAPSALYLQTLLKLHGIEQRIHNAIATHDSMNFVLKYFQKPLCDNLLFVIPQPEEKERLQLELNDQNDAKQALDFTDIRDKLIEHFKTQQTPVLLRRMQKDRNSVDFIILGIQTSNEMTDLWLFDSQKGVLKKLSFNIDGSCNGASPLNLTDTKPIWRLITPHAQEAAEPEIIET